MLAVVTSIKDSLRSNVTVLFFLGKTYTLMWLIYCFYLWLFKICFDFVKILDFLNLFFNYIRVIEREYFSRLMCLKPPSLLQGNHLRYLKVYSKYYIKVLFKHVMWFWSLVKMPTKIYQCSSQKAIAIFILKKYYKSPCGETCISLT